MSCWRYIYMKEETYTRKRVSANWVLFGDANTTYFQAIANGRRHRCTIPLLWEGDRLIQEPVEIRAHVDGFYKELFAARPRSGVRLEESIWDVSQRVSPAKNRALLAPFDEAKVTTIVKGMNLFSSLGADGLPVRFFQTFWHSIKGETMSIFHEFEQGFYDLSRVNFGVISLIAMVLRASDTRQFRPSTITNVIFRIIAKGYASRATLLAP
ncbi:putative NOT transcription complex subunit VIP2 [Hordeum vulgare]|nr:putative NOT transcription complex subunit VIP2 [Hordeum vulgare]